MRYIRQSFYNENSEPLTVVIPEGSLTLPIEVAANQMRRAKGYSPFMDIEIFDGPESLIEATVEGKRRAEKRLSERDRHRGTLRDWGVSMLYTVNPGGVIMTTMTAPLEAEVIKEVLLEVWRHPRYKNQKFVFVSKDQKRVVLANGAVMVEDL